ncbi:MAG: Planctomycete cytochrome [Phycisphaerales bacterium]|nr:Planctomycete cytochrome [Phycisphaerales bacterium]
MHPRFSIAITSLLLAISCAPISRAAATPVDFSRDIQPILSDNCYACHGPDAKARKAKLRLDTKEGAFRIKEDVAVVLPGNPAKSELVRRITTKDQDDLMPPPDSNHKLTPHQIELLTTWVQQGAKWGVHWAFIPPVRPEIPPVKQKDWPRNPIDAFILAHLEKENLHPSPETPREALSRRVTLDLTGLPPTPAEVDAYLADNSPTAYDKVVDRLLASPRYGERMSWEWLDAARYADTNGYQGDSTRTMWPWRDWVVKALNDNMPFDQFTVEQLAGDLLPSATTDQKIATAFNRNHMINGEGGRIADENRVDYVMDQSETMSTIWLGLTVGCARCHDHKFDPITQKEYYQLYAFFNNTPVTGGGGSGQTAPVVDFTTPEQKAKLAELAEHVQQAGVPITEFEKTLFPREEKQTPDASPAAKALSGNLVNELKRAPEKRGVDGLREMVNFYKAKEPQYADALAKLKKTIEARDQFSASIPRVMVMQDMPKPREAFILTKGAYDKPTVKVTAGTPAILPALSTPGQSAGSASAQSAAPDPSKQPTTQPSQPNRLALARWLVSPNHPLTARVTVNRYWQQFFGTGLVKTVEDFGIQGEKPLHPELLDFLATEFLRTKWNVKALHRLIVTSATYRQSSKITPDLFERDPENRLMARGARFRLPAFALRDQALAAAGLLIEKVGGPPVKPYQPPGIWEEATFGKIAYQQDHGDALYRRSLYTFWRRIVGPTEFFDTAARQYCTVRQTRTNTPLQSLTLLNDPTYNEAARALAQRLLTTEGSTPESRLNTAFRLLLARHPSAEEQSVLLQSLDRLKKQYTADKPAALKLLTIGESKRDESLDPTEHAAYTALCTILLNLDETLTKE